jgi:hypothetical protein
VISQAKADRDPVVVLRPPLILRVIFVVCAFFSVAVSLILVADGLAAGLQLASSILLVLVALAFVVAAQPVRLTSGNVEYRWAFGPFETAPAVESIDDRRFVVMSPPAFFSLVGGGRTVALSGGSMRIGVGIHLSETAAASLVSALNDQLDCKSD